ncbi:MAG: hypothetical protein KF886_06655 [Candidatus Hydrogenedentes bacterium]|nr:hypothetical protein [Candidatus Hydrogenedentota bacterium]
MADGVGSTSETGIGALIPWANKLWAVGYVAHIKGDGIGLYEISEDMSMRKHPESVTGTFANRMVHWETEQAIIGPHVIDPAGTVRTIEALKGHRLTATARHLSEPRTMAYFLTMEGLLFEVDLETLEARELFNLVEVLGIQGQPHFKGAHTAQDRLVVANNTYEEPEFLGRRAAGCLAQFDGTNWSVLERNPFVEVSGKQNPGPGSRYGNTLFATGWDRASVILRVLHNGQWSRYLLPKASQSFDHTWNTEWMRIREAQTERYLMDIHGMFYELPPLVYGGAIWGIRPISTHLRIVPDFCYWRGLFVMAGDQTDNAVGQPQSGFWFGNIDDLWQMGKPKGWGGPWWEQQLRADTVSDPFLMTGFDKKVLHLSHDSREPVDFRIEVDFLGNGTWKWYDTFEVPAEGYQHHVFPDGYSAHWARIRIDKACRATAYFMYN